MSSFFEVIHNTSYNYTAFYAIYLYIAVYIVVCIVPIIEYSSRSLCKFSRKTFDKNSHNQFAPYIQSFKEEKVNTN